MTHFVAPVEPLLCKFADGGQKKRQTQAKYPQNGRPWTREGEVRLKSVIIHQKKLTSTHRESSPSATTATFLETVEVGSGKINLLHSNYVFQSVYYYY